ncbi:hypothetical protein JOM56_002839 [Amanita muscaria]
MDVETRFEDPGAATIQTFLRTLPDTVRRQESTRKDARARRQERKLAELEPKREEVRRLKNLKMKEMPQCATSWSGLGRRVEGVDIWMTIEVGFMSQKGRIEEFNSGL